MGNRRSLINIDDPFTMDNVEAGLADGAEWFVSAHGIEPEVAKKVTDAGKALICYCEGDGGGDSWGEASGRLKHFSSGSKYVREQIKNALDAGYSTIYLDNMADNYDSEGIAQYLRVIVEEQQNAGKSPCLFAENADGYADIVRNPDKFGVKAEYFAGGIFECAHENDMKVAQDFAESINAIGDGKVRPTTALIYTKGEANGSGARIDHQTYNGWANKYPDVDMFIFNSTAVDNVHDGVGYVVAINSSKGSIAPSDDVEVV